MMAGKAVALRRRDALRHLLHPRQLTDSMALSKQPSLRNSVLAGAQAAITAAIVLPLVHLSPWPHLIGFASLGALVALFGRFAPAQGRKRIVFLCALWQVLAVLAMSGLAWLGAPVVMQLVLLALSCGVFLFVCTTGGSGAPGALIFVFAAGASMSADLSLEQLVARVSATAAAAALAWAICAATEGLRHLPTAMRPFPAEPQHPLNHRLSAASRSAAGAGIAILASHAFGANHPAWAAMGTLAVMQGAHLHITMSRACSAWPGRSLGPCWPGPFCCKSPRSGP
ncbi:FUSC family protein [Paracoccus denitrificans]|uniref:FUSC family protein n=1 Tax=Paracoccus denitrificans TaxID=266 RepID=UPI001E2FB326|nr:FUSC family protein [Paracoccus denitrificans]UFS67536.1 FUSC family protein [Paracoccus denitrificans]